MSSLCNALAVTCPLVFVFYSCFVNPRTFLFLLQQSDLSPLPRVNCHVLLCRLFAVICRLVFVFHSCFVDPRTFLFLLQQSDLFPLPRANCHVLLCHLFALLLRPLVARCSCFIHVLLILVRFSFSPNKVPRVTHQQLCSHSFPVHVHLLPHVAQVCEVTRRVGRPTSVKLGDKTGLDKFTQRYAQQLYNCQSTNNCGEEQDRVPTCERPR